MLVPLWQLLILAAGASLSAPIAALFFATFAENKVQGFAYGKFIGLGGWVILLGWFVPEPLQWLFGLFPPFWISKAYWMALKGREAWLIALMIGVVLQLGVIRWMMEKFNQIAHQLEPIGMKKSQAMAGFSFALDLNLYLCMQ